MKHEPDILADFALLSSERGGRTGGVKSGYCPNHLVRDDYLAGGRHDYLDAEWVEPGESARAAVTFIGPVAFPDSMFPGRIVRVQEGGLVVGYLTVIEVYNEILQAQADRREVNTLADEEGVACRACDKRILAGTAARNSGLCGPCAQEKTLRDSIPETDEERMALIVREAKERGTLYAIKMHRMILGSTLREAKSAVESAL